MFRWSDQSKKTPDEMVALYENWVRQYPITSIEDGCAEDDWKGWSALTEAIGDRVQLVGDDIFVTNAGILSKGIAEGVANSILDQGEPDWHLDGNSRDDPDGDPSRLYIRYCTSLGRD